MSPRRAATGRSPSIWTWPSSQARPGSTSPESIRANVGTERVNVTAGLDVRVGATVAFPSCTSMAHGNSPRLVVSTYWMTPSNPAARAGWNCFSMARKIRDSMNLCPMIRSSCWSFLPFRKCTNRSWALCCRSSEIVGVWTPAEVDGAAFGSPSGVAR